MFKKFLSLLVFFVFTINLYATDILVEAKAAYFVPTDQKFRKIYSGGGIYGGEVTCQTYQNFYGWISADCFSKKGSSIGEHDSTKITIVPLGVGLKYLYPISCADLYLGAGVLGTYVHMKDDSPFVIHNISKWGLGGVAKAGAIFQLRENIFADLFTSYTYTKIDFHYTDHERVNRQNANLGGWAFGIGIGYRFGCSN